MYYHNDYDSTAAAVPLNWMLHHSSFPLYLIKVILAMTGPPHFEVFTACIENMSQYSHCTVFVVYL